jgi:hypothetical protein
MQQSWEAISRLADQVIIIKPQVLIIRSLRSSGMCCRVTGCFVPCVARQRIGLIVKGHKVPEEILIRPHGCKNNAFTTPTNSQPWARWIQCSFTHILFTINFNLHNIIHQNAHFIN